MIAAKTNDNTIAYFLKDTNCWIDKTPNLTSKSKMTGN
mgnify:CR=1 FL=1